MADNLPLNLIKIVNRCGSAVSNCPGLPAAI
jgi:hypothetical protein